MNSPKASWYWERERNPEVSPSSLSISESVRRPKRSGPKAAKKGVGGRIHYTYIYFL